MVRRMEQKPRPWQQPELAWSSDGEGEPGLSEDIWLDKKVVEMLQATQLPMLQQRFRRVKVKEGDFSLERETQFPSF